MTRSMTGALDTALDSDQLRDAILVHFAFDSGDVRVWSGIGDLVWDSNTYSGTGLLGSVSDIGESVGLNSVGMSFTLSGILTSSISIALGEFYQGRAVTVWRAFFDANDAIIADPLQIFSGRMDVMQIDDSGDMVTITVTAENRLIDLRRPNEIRFYTDQDQRAEYPGDKGLEFVGAMREQIILWGRNEVGVKKTSDSTGGMTSSTGSETEIYDYDGVGDVGDVGDAGEGEGGDVGGVDV
ncbi:MAG: hypothetical protein KAJ19_14000 [Gammaproteobacteria bacterium]|nr:hypothetical protein [Gammaproteobacteria bacterium]